MLRQLSLLLVLLLLTCGPKTVTAVLPTLELDVRVGGQSILGNEGPMLLSHAFFGPYPPMLSSSSSSSSKEQQPQPLTLTYPPDSENDPLLCQNHTSSGAGMVLPSNSLLLVPRGECTFQHKVLRAQQIGAAAVIVYGTLASRYALNTTAAINQTKYQFSTRDIIYPGNKYDYDCSFGEAWIPASAIRMDDPLPYAAAHNDPVLSSFSFYQDTPNLCVQHAKDALQNCASQACLLTGNRSNDDSTSSHPSMQACCAWDLSIWLYPDYDTPPAAANTTNGKESTEITIPSAFMTMQQFSDLMALQIEYNGNTVANGPVMTVLLYARWRPYYNSSAVLIWVLGCCVAALAAYLSASDYHAHTARVWQKRRQQQQQAPRSPSNNSSSSPRHRHHHHPVAEEVLELTAAHAAGFIVMASTSLLVLFYFKIYGIVKVFYAIGCSTAVTQIIIHPLGIYIRKRCFPNVKGCRREVIVFTHEETGDVTLTQCITHAVGWSLGLVWLLMAFLVRDAENHLFFWVMQDVFGSCMCIVFLKVIRLNSIRVAAILLIVAFFYDIFFVFVTPLLFQGKSVMITVATSGGPPKADAVWCEKYPDDPDCQGGNPLPMLLTIPKLFDFVGGSSLLGLGDIVLPGLLLSFAARLDAAKQLLGVMGGGRGVPLANNGCGSSSDQEPCGGACGCCCCCSWHCCRGGYLAPLVVAYAVGLAMANAAVYIMEMGQPALLYLVPTCLGTMCYLGWCRNELLQLWDGPRVLKAADEIVFGPSGNSISGSPTMQHTALPTEDNDDDNEDNVTAAAPPSAVADEEEEGTRMMSTSK